MTVQSTAVESPKTRETEGSHNPLAARGVPLAARGIPLIGSSGFSGSRTCAIFYLESLGGSARGSFGEHRNGILLSLARLRTLSGGCEIIALDSPGRPSIRPSYVSFFFSFQIVDSALPILSFGSGRLEIFRLSRILWPLGHRGRHCEHTARIVRSISGLMDTARGNSWKRKPSMHARIFGD